MTAIVTILALTPLALGLSDGALLSASLATVVIGGLFSSALLTLFVIPAVYSLFDGLRARFTRGRTGSIRWSRVGRWSQCLPPLSDSVVIWSRTRV